MSKYKILTVVGTRPEIIRLSRCISSFEKNFDHVLVHTNQNYDYELNKIFFKDLSLKLPKYSINHKNKKIYEILGKNFIEVEKIIFKEKPDAFVVLGDTNSALTSYVAKRCKIPIIHIEAGNRCFDDNVPEEINRRIVDHIADLNIVYSDFAKKNLLKEGILNNNIVKLGSPLFEVINFYKSKFIKKKVTYKYNVEENKFFLFSFHREENLLDEKKIKSFIQILNFLENKFKIPILISTHPRLKKIINKNIKKIKKNIQFLKPFSFSEYISLQLAAKLVISDSGSLTEETSILDLKSIVLRDTFERQEGLGKSTVILCPANLESFKKVINLEIKASKKIEKRISEYENPDFSENLCRIITTKIPYINKYTWNKIKN